MNIKCDPDKAGRCAGRFGWACTTATGRIGLSFIKPLYAQVHSPLPGFWASPLLVRSCIWWKCYLRLNPVVKEDAHALSRRQVIAWAEAEGEGMA